MTAASGIPTALYGRLDGAEGWKRLARSEGPFPAALEAERERFAIEVLGSRPATETFDSVVAHWPSRVAPGSTHVARIVEIPGSQQPVRCVATLTDELYARLGWNPWVAEAAGLFRFAEAFLRDPGGAGDHCSEASIPAKVQRVAPPCLRAVPDATLAALLDPLLRGRRLLLRAPGVRPLQLRLFELLWHCLPPERRRNTTLLGYTFASTRQLRGLEPVLACQHDASEPAWDVPRPPGPAEEQALELVRQRRALTSPIELPEPVFPSPGNGAKGPTNLPERPAAGPSREERRWRQRLDTLERRLEALALAGEEQREMIEWLEGAQQAIEGRARRFTHKLGVLTTIAIAASAAALLISLTITVLGVLGVTSQQKGPADPPGGAAEVRDLGGESSGGEDR